MRNSGPGDGPNAQTNRTAARIMVRTSHTTCTRGSTSPGDAINGVSLPQGIMPISMTWPSPHQNTCAATARNLMHGGQTRAAPMVICDVVSTHCHCHAMHRDLWCPRHERHATRCCLRCIARKRREKSFQMLRTLPTRIRVGNARPCTLKSHGGKKDPAASPPEGARWAIGPPKQVPTYSDAESSTRVRVRARASRVK